MTRATHRLVLLCATTLAIVPIAPVLRAQSPATSPAAEIEALIQQLSSDDWPRRQGAEERLVRLAQEAVPRLRAVAEAAQDAEVRTRCESALHRIAQNERVGATIVTLRLDGATPREAFESLARQASPAPLRAHPPTLWDVHPGAASQRVTLEAEHVPFWEAARRLGAATGLELRPGNDELRVTPASGRMRGPSVVSGPLLIVANSINRSAAVDLATGAASSDFTVSFTVIPEPKLRVLRSWPNVRVEHAADENGASLVPPPLRQESYQTSSRQSSWPVIARLSYPPNAGKRIAVLRGAVTFAAQTQSETVEIPDLLGARDVRREFGAGAVTVKLCRQIGNQYELVVVLARPRRGGAQPFDQFRQALLPGLRVLDADGRVLARGATSTSGGEDRVETTIRFNPDSVQPPADRPGPPARLVWEIPTESRDITAPFEFTDLPLP